MNKFEEGLKDLVSEQFNDGEPMPVRNETTGKFVSEKSDDHDEEVGAREKGAEDNEDGSENDSPEYEEDPVDPEDDEDDEDDEDADEDKEPADGEDADKGKGKGRFQKRVDTLTASVRRLERELKSEREAKVAAAEAEKRVPKRADGTPFASASDYARAALSDDKAPKKPNPAAKDADGKPKYKLGEFDELYAEDKDDYLDARRRYLDIKEREYDTLTTTPVKDTAAASQQEFQTKLNSTIEVGKKAYKDFDEKVVKGIEKDAWPLSEVGANFLIDSEVGADIAYHLATSVKVAKEIATLSPIAQVKRLTKLEDKFIADAAEKAKRAKRGSSAPEPIHEKARGAGGKERSRFDSEDFAAVEASWNKVNKRR